MSAHHPPPRWAIHPQPSRDETLTSWLTRVARANAASLTSWMSAEHGVAAWRREESLDTDDSGELWERIAARSGVTGGVAALRAMSFSPLPTRVTPWLLPSWRPKQTKRRPRWCPQCVATDAATYFRRSWRWEWAVWCPVDGTRLRDACHGCGEALSYPRVRWNRPLTECWNCHADLTISRPDLVPAPDLVRAASAAAHERMPTLTSDDIDTLWSLQRFVRLAGWRPERGSFVPPAFVPGAAELPRCAAMSPEETAISFAVAWRLFADDRDDLPAIARLHQGTFNAATAHRCPEWLRALRRPVRVVHAPLTHEAVADAIERVRIAGKPIHYVSVAAELGRDNQAINICPAWRALVDAAAPPVHRVVGEERKRIGRHRVQPQWVAEMERGIEEACDRLSARDVRPSRAALAREMDIAVEVLIRFECVTKRKLTGLAADRKLAKVREAVALLKERGARVSVLGVARALGWARATIDRDPAVKAAVQGAMPTRLTGAMVGVAIDAVVARGELVTAAGVSREMGCGRYRISDRTDLIALVKAARAKQRDALAGRVRAAVTDLHEQGAPVTGRSVATAIGKPTRFFEHGQHPLRALVPSSSTRRV